MNTSRREFLACGIGACMAVATRSAGAAEWPDKPLRLVIGYPPGGSADGVARPLLVPLEKALGQPVVMDYRPGAGGLTAAEAVSRSAPDGYLIHVIEGGVMTALPHLRKLSFDPAGSLQPIGMVATGGAVIVANPAAGIQSLDDLVRIARASPDKLSYGTSGIGGAQHLAAEQFLSAAGIRIQHVPYKGGAPAMSDLVGGQIPLLFSSMTPAIPFVKSGKIKALGVTSLTRATALPEVPTVAEQGFPGYEAIVWLAVVAPRGLPAAVAGKLAAAVTAATTSPTIQAEIRAQGYEPLVEGPDALARRIQADNLKWARLIKSANIALE